MFLIYCLSLFAQSPNVNYHSSTDLVFVPGTERDEAPQPMSEDQLQELTRKMDILYRHFFQKWDLIGKHRYLGRPMKKRVRLFDEEVDADKENQQQSGGINVVEDVLPDRMFDTHAVRKRRIEYAEVQKKGLNWMATLAKK
jgi:hypothetical protein